MISHVLQEQFPLPPRMYLQRGGISVIVICGLIAIAIGFVNIFMPSFAWYLKEGWICN